MPHKLFAVTSVNPNDTTGGGGCVCDPTRQIDCKPPYAVFYGNDMENISSPHVVICQSCAEAVVEKFQGEILASGETGELIETLPAEFVDVTCEDDEDIPEV